MSIQLIIVVLYIALLFAISFYVKKRADKGSAEYLLAGRKLGPMLIAVNVTGLAVGAASTVGVAENAYKVGMAAGWYNAAWSAGAIIMGLVAAGKLRKMKVTTIPEFFEKYYDTKGRVISAVGLIIIMSVITALQYLAGGAILASLLPEYFDFHGGMIVSAVVFIGITLIGGLWSSGFSNIVSVVLIYAGILYSCVAAVDHTGGIENIAAQLPAGFDWFDPFAGIPLAVIIGWFIVMITQAITSGPVPIACGARDEKAARTGLAFCARFWALSARCSFRISAQRWRCRRLLWRWTRLPAARRLLRCGQRTYLPPARFCWARARCSARIFINALLTLPLRTSILLKLTA